MHAFERRLRGAGARSSTATSTKRSIASGADISQHALRPATGSSSRNPTDPTKDIEAAVSFYATNLFLDSPAARELDARFGAPVNVGPVIGPIGRFLRVLNASFNLAIADQRMTAARALNVAFWAYRDDVQKGLLRLASEEIDDAIRVLENGGTDLHPSERASLATAHTLLAQAVAATDPGVRRDRTDSARALVVSSKAAFGTNITFQLGAGNLMF